LTSNFSLGLVTKQVLGWILESFPLDLAQVEPAIVAHKINDSVELLVDEVGIIADYRYADDGHGLVVLMVNFGNRDIESAFEPAYKALDYASFSL
jgi:hypothetical protein